MSQSHVISTRNYTLALVDQDIDRYLPISGYTGSDGSAYLTINSGTSINYAKFSYHPRENRFQYAFTDELWGLLNKAGKGRPNKERVKSITTGVGTNQVLCNILIDHSALFRRNVPSNEWVKINFPKYMILSTHFSLENCVPVVTHRFFDMNDTWAKEINEERNKIYSQHRPDRPSLEISGIAHLMNDYQLPWRMLCIGV